MTAHDQNRRFERTVDMDESLGWLAERSNATVLKTADGATRPGVRIPHHPPQMENVPLGTFFIGVGMAIWNWALQRSCWVRQQVDFTNVNAVKSLRLQRRHKVPR